MKKLALLLAVLAVAVGDVRAIPCPAAVYCGEQGYEYEIRTGEYGQYGVCIFPDGSECDEWQFYCNCEPNGIGCWPGDFNCHWPCEELACREAGEGVLVSECCAGLIEIMPVYTYDDNCNFNGMTGWVHVCSDCGNGICESWESKCNCPEDCNCLDTDNDSTCDWADNCPYDYNPEQDDTDGDGIGGICDNCPDVYNPGQADDDGDGFGNACDGCTTVSNPPGDFNGDCYVSLKDSALIYIHWRDTDCGVANLWCNRVDYNQDTDVTLEEVLLVALNWLNCTDPDPPCNYVP